MDRGKAFNGLLLESDRHVNLSAQGRAFRGFFVGFKPPEYLIIDVPKSAELSDWLSTRRTIIGSFCTQGMIVRFDSTVIAFLRQSAWLLIVTYPPKLVKIHDLRKSYRVECNFPCKVVTVSDLKEYFGLLTNVSTGGCKCTLLAIPPNQIGMLNEKKQVLLEFELPGSRGKKGLFGEILQVVRFGTEIALGMKFSSENEIETLEQLNAYILNVAKVAGA